MEKKALWVIDININNLLNTSKICNIPISHYNEIYLL